MVISIDWLTSQKELAATTTEYRLMREIRYNGAAPSALALPVAKWYRCWLNCFPLRGTLQEFLTAQLRAGGWAHPEAFFADGVSRCPMTGEIVTSTERGFPMNNDYVVLHDGGVAHHTAACWFGDDYMPDGLSGYILISSCRACDGETLYPLHYLQSNASKCLSCGLLFWNHQLSCEDECPACRMVGHPALGGLTLKRQEEFKLLAYNDHRVNRLGGRENDKYGCELELLVGGAHNLRGDDLVNVISTHAQAAVQCFPENYCVAKHDGSLRGYGFELVTKPDSYNKMHNALRSGIPRLNSALTTIGQWSGGDISVGLHINMERKGKTAFHLAKILYFMFAKENREFNIAIAGRIDENYAAFPAASRWRHIFTPPLGGTKYVAVYVKEKVLEFRLFASSTEVSFILSCLEFCEALTMFTAVSSAQQLHHRAFQSFVLSRYRNPTLLEFQDPRHLVPTKFPHLAHRLLGLGFLPTT